MREIKFRGRRTLNGEWVYGNLMIKQADSPVPETSEPYKCYYIVPIDGLDYYYEHEIDPSTIGQYTGLKDSNGKEIYEGEILNVIVIRQDFVVHEYQTDVRFEDGSFVIKGEGSEYHNTFLCAYINPNVPIVEIEIIGNIHDNPELLKGGGER